jgi:membrane protein YdbS with pleckstrin-like domain
MRCDVCGLETPTGSSFCNHCGATLSDQGKMQKLSSAVPPPVGASTPPPAAVPQFATGVAPPQQQPEQELFDEYPSMRPILPRLILLLVIFIVAIVLETIFISEAWPHKGRVQWLTTLAFVILVLLAAVAAFLRVRSVKYRLTSQRLFVTNGLFNKRTDELELEQYKDIYIKQDLLDKLVGCGDIQVITTDETNGIVDLVDVLDPVTKKELIRGAARDRKQALGILRREEL